MVLRIGLVVAPVAVTALLAAQPVQAAEHSVDVWARSFGPSTTVLANPGSSFGVDAVVPASDVDVDVRLSFDFSAVGGVVTITQPDWFVQRCSVASGPRYDCGASVRAEPFEQHVSVGFDIATNSGVTWRTARVPVEVALVPTAGVSDPDLSNNRLEFTLDLRSDLADVTVTHSGSSYVYVDPDCCGAQVRVTAPNPLDARTFVVTFDTSQVQHAVVVTPTSGCTKVSTAIYRCERTIIGGGTGPYLETYFDLGLSPKAGAPAGPAGRIRAEAEQVGGVDPDSSNNTVFFDIDVDTGGGVRVRADAGEASASIGDTVKVPITLTNLGPDTVEWMAASFEGWNPGLEVVGYDGCAGDPQIPRGMCDTGRLAGGESRNIRVIIKVTGCPNPFPQYRPLVGVSHDMATILDGRAGGVKVAGCPGGSSGETGTGAGGAPGPITSDGGATTDTTSAPGTAEQTGGAGTAAQAASAAPAPPVGDFVPLGDVDGQTGGLGLAGLLMLLALLVTGRSLRWMVTHSR